MPRFITDNEQILAAMNKVEMFASVSQKIREEWLKGFVDQGGKSSGPLVHLKAYNPNERVLEEYDWGGNSFLILVDGALDVYMTDTDGKQNKVNEIFPGESFGEMSLFAGVPRTASVFAVAPRNSTAQESLVLEIVRPAFREAKKAQQFIDELAHIYELRGLDTAIEQIRQSTPGAFSTQQLDQLQTISAFKVFGRSHLLFRLGQSIDKVYLIKNGWVRRSSDSSYETDAGTGWAAVGSEGLQADFLGAGNFLGIESLATPASMWEYNATVMLRTEVMEIDLALLRANRDLCEAARKAFARFSPLDDGKTCVVAAGSRETLKATEDVITTGIVEAENVLVMDMDLCIRCGNCSFACEKVQPDGRSRLVRRGIHIARTPQTRPQSTQHILVPEVCIHCQDPECLTACPTGAIARHELGQIDIEAATCTGCFACARLCPYNAISMVPEKPTPEVQPRRALQLTSWLGLTPPIVPAPVTSTKNEESLIAAKCNLCVNTPLNPNPEKGQSPKYSCEENCPTGALVRVNPREYFDEVRAGLGLVFQSPTMAVGRNIHRRDPFNRWCHIIGILSVLISLSVALLTWRHYGFALPLRLRWLSGVFGLLASGAAMTYSSRRRIYKRRAGPLRYWLLAHVYLGVVAGLAILVHGASHGGGPLTTLLMVSFDLVLLTGLFGLSVYYVAPRLLTSIEGDPILREDLEARRGELRKDLAGLATQSAEFRRLLDGPTRRFASFRYLLRQVWRREELSAMLADAREEYRAATELLAKDQQMTFIEGIEKLATLRRLDALIYLHHLLKLWLPPHIIATSLMLGLLLLHILQVTLFAVR